MYHLTQQTNLLYCSLKIYMNYDNEAHTCQYFNHSSFDRHLHITNKTCCYGLCMYQLRILMRLLVSSCIFCLALCSPWWWLRWSQRCRRKYHVITKYAKLTPRAFHWMCVPYKVFITLSQWVILLKVTLCSCLSSLYWDYNVSLCSSSSFSAPPKQI